MEHKRSQGSDPSSGPALSRQPDWLLEALAIRISRGVGLARRRQAEMAQGRSGSSDPLPARLEALARRRDEQGDLGPGLIAAEGYLSGTVRVATFQIPPGLKESGPTAS